MKSGRSIQDVSREILRQQEAKADYLVATDRLYMDTYGDSPVIRVLDREGIDQIEPLEIQQTAHQQIGTYLDIPSKYYDRMLQRDPALLSYNVNRWFQKEPEQKLLRTMDGKARAFLSNRYRRIDNLDIARVVLPIIGEMEGARFESCEITDDRMYLKVVNPRLQAEVVPGDIVQAGIMISNSETGLGAVNIQPLIYRLVCSNGMVVNEAGTRRAHIGRVNTTDVNFALYSQQTLDAEDRAFVLKIQDTVRAAVDEEIADREAQRGIVPEAAEAGLEIAETVDDDGFVGRPAQGATDEGRDRGRDPGDRAYAAGNLFDVDARVGERSRHNHSPCSDSCGVCVWRVCPNVFRYPIFLSAIY